MTFQIIKTLAISSLRDRITLFYTVAFPLVLLFSLSIFFNDPSYRPVVLTGVVAISTLFWSIQGVAFQVLQQRTTGVYKLLQVTPFSTIAFVFHLTLARTFISLLVTFFIFFVGLFYFNFSITVGAFLNLTALLIFATICFTVLGFLIANLSMNEAQVSMVSSLVCFPMIFTSEAFYSLENAPVWFALIGKLFPFHYFIQGLQAIVHNGGSYFSLFILGLYLIAFLILTTVSFRSDQQGSLFPIRNNG